MAEQLSLLVSQGMRILAVMLSGETKVLAEGSRSQNFNPDKENEKFARNMVKLDMENVEKLEIYGLTKDENGKKMWTLSSIISITE